MTLVLLHRERRLVAVKPTAVCAHDLHIHFGGEWLGLFVHPSGGSASLNPCPHVNEDGL